MAFRREDFETARAGAIAGRRPPSRLPALLLASVLAASAAPAASAQVPRADSQIVFDIPAQSLARALVAYGSATGLDVFYNATFAERQRSTDVIGSYTPVEALQQLLRGTGYVARVTAPDAFTIEPGPRQAMQAGHPAVPRRQLDAYFAGLQSSMNGLLCRHGEFASGRELLLQLWLAPSGVVARAEAIDYDGRPVGEQTLAGAMRGLALAAPPAGMPQPVTLVIFPPANGERSCAHPNGRPRR